MRNSLIAFLCGCAIATGATYWVVNGKLGTALGQISELQGEVSKKQNELLGYTNYTTYLTAGKQTLAEQLKLLSASVVRDEGATEVIEKQVLGMSSTGTVAVWYTVEYSFGFDLGADNYEVRPVSTGIEIRTKRPTLVTSPAVTNLRNKVLSGGVFTDEDAAVKRLYEEASRRAQVQGKAMAMEPAVMALCEKKLIAFLHDFLAKQPGVKVVPAISVVYR
jgi:hypothetical protein